MKTFLFILALANTSFLMSMNASDSLYLSGSIGKYKIHMIIDSNEASTGIFKGRYRYDGKVNHLELSGENYESCIHMTESFKGKTTGEFFLNFEEDKYTGYWVSGTKSFPVTLEIKTGNRALLDTETTEERSISTSDQLNGTYESNYYWVNDMWYEEGKPSLEIGYNGGKAIFELIDDGSLRFDVQVVCGPTYHFAMASGIAKWNGTEYEGIIEESCVIKIQFNAKTVHVAASGGMECGFGARAYLDHDFIKTSDVPEEIEH